MKVKINKEKLPSDGKATLSTALKNVKHKLKVSWSRVNITFNCVENHFFSGL